MTDKNINQPARPWLKSNGTIKSDEQIRTLSKNWSLETWEQFLSETVDNEEAYQREEPNYVSEESLDCFTESIWDGADSDRMDFIATELRKICRNSLTPHQQHIIRGFYWNRLSERELAEKFWISRSSVRTQRQRALEKIREQVVALGLLEGGRPKSPKRESLQELTKFHDANLYIGIGAKSKKLLRNELLQSVYDAETEKQKFTFRGGDL